MIIVGGIFSGLFSPTEAAAVTVLYAILIDLAFYRELDFRRFWDAIYETATVSSSIATIIASVSLLGFVLAREQAPQQITALFLAIADGPVSFLIMVNERASQGAAWANAIVARSAAAVATLCADLGAVLGLDRVAIGGSVGLAEGYLERVARHLDDEPALFRLPVLRATLGQDSALCGALAAARLKAMR